MTAKPDAYGPALDRARRHVERWLESQRDRPVPPRMTTPEVMAAIGTDLPDGPSDPAEVVDLLAQHIEPGLMAMPSGRFFGWVIGGTLPAALAADWMVSGWDQNTGMRYPRPAPAAWRRSRPAGCSTCSACRGAPTSVSSPAGRWPTSPGSPRAGSRS